MKLRSRIALRQLCLLLVVALASGATALAQSTTSINSAVTWLNGQQRGNGTWGSLEELVPRDTARVVHAQTLLRQSNANLGVALAWLGSQNALDANQFLAEQALALTVSKLDATAVLTRLTLQRSNSAPDYGGFSEYSGNSYDSALAVQAFAVNEQLFTTAISGAMTTLLARQNADGGWGLDRGFDSNPVVTAEVLVALSSMKTQQPPPVVVTAAQAYLAARRGADGSYGNVLETAVVYRALALSGYPLSSLSAATMTYLQSQQAGNGSWGNNDPFVTARVLEAYAANKANLAIQTGDFKLTPSSVAEGGNVQPAVKITNIGAAPSAATTVTIYVGDKNGRVLATANVNAIAPGASFSPALSPFAATNLSGTQTILALIDPNGTLDEIRKDDNSATATLIVDGKPDLQVFGTDIVTSPARVQPDDPATLAVTIRNFGEGDATNVGWAIFDTFAGSEKLLKKDTIASIAAGTSQVVSIPITFPSGAHTIRAVADPDSLIAETSETNNTATRSVSVATVSRVDLRIEQGSVTAVPPRPNAGESITITALVENTGTDPVESRVAFFDGAPGVGGTLIAVLPVAIDAQSSQQVQATFITTATSRVIYAVADPDNLLFEIDERNNQAFFALTDQFADLVILADGLVLPKGTLSANQTISARVVVRNNGVVGATGVRVVVYDDLPQNGGVLAADRIVDIPAQGKVVISATWAARGGQRFATAAVNPDRSVFEADYANNRVTRLYSVNGNEADVSLLGTRANSIDTTRLVVSANELTVMGVAEVEVTGPSNKSYTVLLFEDADGDGAFNVEADNALGSTLVPTGLSNQAVQIAAEGSVRFAPGKLYFYLDATNAVNEINESNNIIDIYQNCETTITPFTPGVKWSNPNRSVEFAPVARIVDTNGDDVVDGNDVPHVVQPSNGAIALLRGDTGALVWVQNFDVGGRQIAPVIADVDNDGRPEIIVHEYEHKLVALNGDGTRKWTSPNLERDPAWENYVQTIDYTYVGAPVVADLDGDGKPEVISGRTCLNGADGTIKWVGTGGAGRQWAGDNLYLEFFPDQEAPIAVDLNNDGKLEVVAGNTAYRADGTILWQRTDLTDGYTAPFTLPGLTTPWICLVTRGKVYMLNGVNGTTVWGPVTIPGGAGTLLGGAPTIFTDGGGHFVGVAGDGFYSVINAFNGVVRWTRQTTTNLSFGITTTNAASVFDFTGTTTLVYAARDKLIVYRSDDGAVFFTVPITQEPFFPMVPVVADVDGDGHADIIVPGTTGIKVISEPTWKGAPAIFNELAYHVVNVSNEMAAIPSRETQTAFSKIFYRANTAIPVTGAPQPNLTGSYLRADTNGYPASVKLIARIGNSGWAAAPPSKVTFFRVNANNTTTTLGNADVPALEPGAYADVAFTILNPSAGVFTFHARADGVNAVAECNENDNLTPNLSIGLSVDVAADQALLLVSDPQPRPADVIQFTALANVSGAIDDNALRAQFYLGAPSAGGAPISGLLPVTVTSVRGKKRATVEFQWTVSAPPGPATVFVVFDPANAIPEEDETNNSGSYLLDVSTAEAILELDGTITLTPPSSEPGKPIAIRILLQNIGNVALGQTTLNYSVTGGAGTGFNGSATVPPLAKNDFREITVGTFTPAASGTYTVTVTSGDPAVRLLASAKDIRIAPFAGAEMTAVPSRIPTTLPIVQTLTRLSRTNTIVIPDDSIVPLIVASLKKGLNWQAPVLNNSMNDNCYKCHVQAQGMVAFEASLQVSGVTVDTAVENRMYTQTVTSQAADGHFGVSGFPRTTTILGAWQLSYWHDPVQASPYLIKALDAMIGYQRADGAFDCDHCDISYGNREAMTMMAMIGFARGYELTADPRYLAALTKAVSWCVAYDFSATRTTEPAFAARVGIGLAYALPQISDPNLSNTVKSRVRNIAAFLAGLQNPDGSFGIQADPDIPVIRTAQSLYAIALSGVPGTDPGLRAAILWLINNQQPNGGWREFATDTIQVHWLDESTWAMISLPAAFARLGQFDVDLEVFLPSATDAVSSNIPPGALRTVTGGRVLQWRFPGVTEEGIDLLMNVKLNGIQHDEQRAVAGSATITYKDPYSGEPVVRNVPVPLVTGFAPLTLAVRTDQEVYPPASPVTITETITNVGTTNDAITNDLVIEDANGTKVATVVANDPIIGLPPRPFPGWRYAMPLSATITREGVNRQVAFDIDFAQKLAVAGVAGTFDRNSLRVSTDAIPNEELHFAWLPKNAAASLGTLAIRIPDGIPNGGTFTGHVFFDVVENGFKPQSMFDLRNAVGVGAGLLAKYWYLDTTRSNPNASLPSLVYTTAAPVLTMTQTTTNIMAPAPPRNEYWGTEWTGALFVPAAGTYGFRIGSDDGSWLYIDDQLVTSLPGLHGTIETTKNVTLTAGFHSFKFVVFNWCCGWSGYVKWAPPGSAFDFIPGANLLGSLPASSSEVTGAVETLSDGSVTRTHVWNTGATASGPYRATGSLSQFGSLVARGSDDFAISPAASLTGSIATDKAGYESGETVRVTATTLYATGNTTLTNLTAIVTIFNPAGAAQSSSTTPIASMLPGQSVPARLEWPAGNSLPGTYRATLVVKDEQQTTLVDTSAPFEILPASQTGNGIGGTIATPPAVNQGESLPISISITNGGNTALAGAPFEVKILDPLAQSTSDSLIATLPFTASVDTGQTFTTQLSQSTAALKLQTYQAFLVSMITGTPVLLAQTAFEVKNAPLKLDLSIGGPARVLIWANCANGNSTQPCTPAAPPFLTKTLTDARIPWTLAGTQYEFIAALRTGAYDEAIVYQPGAFEAKIAEEYLQTIQDGIGLIYIKNDTNADPKLLPALGVSFRGKRKAASTVLDVLASPFTAAGQLSLNGDSVTLALEGAEVAAKIAATDEPSITYRTFGKGRVVTIPYDTELTPSADVAKLLLDAVHYVPRPRVLDARRVIPIDFAITPPPGVASTLAVEAVLPAGMSVVFAQPELAQGTSWTAATDGTPFHLYVWVRLPEEAGTYEIRGKVAFAGQIAVAETTIAIEVTGRAELENSLAAQLTALAAAATSAKDEKAIADANAELTAIRAATPADAAAVVPRVLALINHLQTVSLDTSAARERAGRLLVYWQSRI